MLLLPLDLPRIPTHSDYYPYTIALPFLYVDYCCGEAYPTLHPITHAHLILFLYLFGSTGPTPTTEDADTCGAGLPGRTVAALFNPIIVPLIRRHVWFAMITGRYRMTCPPVCVWPHRITPITD